PAKKSSKPNSWKVWFTYPRVLIVIILLFLLIGGALGSYAWYNVPRAEVALTVAKQTVTEDVVVALRSEQENVDHASMSVPVSVQQVVKEGNREFTTTGIKETGEKALGSIVVYNWTDVSVQLSVGHVFTVNAGQE